MIIRIQPPLRENEAEVEVEEKLIQWPCGHINDEYGNADIDGGNGNIAWSGEEYGNADIDGGYGNIGWRLSTS
jgi:hypothetical protein